MTRPTPLAILLVLLAAAAPVIDGFVVRTPAPRSSPSGPSSSRHGACTGLGPARGTAGAALQLQSQSIRAGSRSALRMMGGGVESVTPVLLAQLAGCAALVGTGKVLLKQEEEEGIEPAAPWCVRVWNHLMTQSAGLIGLPTHSCHSRIYFQLAQGGGPGALGGGGPLPGHVGPLLRLLQRGARL